MTNVARSRSPQGVGLPPAGARTRLLGALVSCVLSAGAGCGALATAFSYGLQGSMGQYVVAPVPAQQQPRTVTTTQPRQTSTLAAATGQSGSPTDAEYELARQAYMNGQQMFDNGRYQEAVAYFQQSYDIVQFADTLFNMAACYDALGRTAEARVRYEAIIASPDVPEDLRAQARESLARFAPSSAPRTVATSGTSTSASAATEVRWNPDDEAWEATARVGTDAAYRSYLATFPAGAHAMQARAALEVADWRAASSDGTIDAYRHYLEVYPDGAHAAEAEERAETLAWDDVQVAGTDEAMSEYLDEFPFGAHAGEARAATVETLIQAGHYDAAETRIAGFEAQGGFDEDAQAFRDRIADARRQAEQQIQRTRGQALSIAAGCENAQPGTPETRAIALRAYRKLDGIRGEISSSELSRIQLEIAVTCHNCSRDCANGN